jgi:cation diffusion facilitator CzcD-associated flavoprotein CzcO
LLEFSRPKFFTALLMEPKKKTALIIGAGPAGLTAAYELLMRDENKAIVSFPNQTGS